MERRKGIGKVSTGKRNVPVSEPVDGARSVVPVPVKPFVPKSPSSTSISSSFNPSQPLPESAEVREYNVRVPKITKRQYNLMRFNGALNVDFAKWNNVRIQREDNAHLYKLPDFGQSEMPKFGAGSEYGREQREEARRRKYGLNKKKYKREDQPWILKTVTGDATKKFKGLREGGVNDNASYFIFTQAQDGCFEVFPIKEWYNFTPIQRYKALTAEEAEEQFSKRNKILNLFSVMVQQRMREDKEDVEEEKGEKGGKSKGKGSDMQVTDMDDWVEEMDEDDEDSDEETEDAEKPKKGKKKPVKKEKDSDDELDLEDSDDGDEEGREQDYSSDISSESEDEEEKKPDLPGIDQDDNLRSLLESGSSSEDEDEDKKKKEEVQEEETEAPEGGKKKKKKKKKDDKKTVSQPDAPILDEEIPSEDTVDTKPDLGADLKVESVTVNEDSNSLKRKAAEGMVSTPKKPKVDLPSSILQLAASEGITEEAVKKYLLRKPMTIAELLQKFKPKKSKISSNDMVPIIAHILKKLNPMKRSHPNKTYFFINKQ